jgi:carbamoyltransferase
MTSLAQASPRILGFSGLARARSYRRQWWPDLTERESAIVQGIDAAAALVVDDQVWAAAEERFNGVKHTEAFPCGAASYCLEASGTTAHQLDVVAHSFNYEPERHEYARRSDFNREYFAHALSPDVNRREAELCLGIDLAGRFVAVEHHLAHAASAFVPSGFDEALVYVSDGIGERYSASAMVADARGYKVVQRIAGLSSLGLLYGVVTLYLGFGFSDGEYKVMGLAPYGDADRYLGVFLEHLVQMEPEGRYSVPLLLTDNTDLERETFRGSLDILESRLGPPREPTGPIEQRHKDIAAGLQSAIQLVQIHTLGHLAQETGMRRLCVAGGVGLNCVANGAVLRSGLFDDMYVQPASGDDGSALGAALHVQQEIVGRVAHRSRTLVGPEYDDDACWAAVDGLDLVVHELLDVSALVESVAELLESGCVIGWCRGRMEFGARALGNRSIVADPRRPEMRDRINRLVKKRESFRPFAPAVPVERVAEFFDVDPALAHRFSEMLFTASVRPEFVELLPATTHVDDSARVQTVARTENPTFWALLDAFGRRTGTPIVLNTSFNLAGQPIVRNPAQAVETFLRGRLDAVVLNSLLVRKP